MKAAELRDKTPDQLREELRLLARCDREGRQVGVPVPDVTDAIEYLRELDKACGE